MKRNADIGTEGMHTKNTFWGFMQMSRLEESDDKQDEDEHTNRTGESKSAPSSQTPMQDQMRAPLTISQAMQQLDALQDKEDKRAYIKSLPASMQGEVKAALIAKAEETKVAQEQAKQAQFDAELDDLL